MLFHIKTRVSLRYFVSYCRSKTHWTTKSVTYPGRLGEWSTDLGTKNLEANKQFSGFLFSLVPSSENTLLQGSMINRIECLRKYFHSFKYVIDKANLWFFLLNFLRACFRSLNRINGLFELFGVISSVLLTASFHLRLRRNSQSFIAIKTLYLRI